MNLPAAYFFGRATVVGMEGTALRLETPDRFPLAHTTLTFAYVPTVGDQVVAIETPAGWYVIGVLEQNTPPRPVAKGNLTLAAPNGKIRLKAAREITLHSRDVTIVANTIHRTAHTLHERLHSAALFVRHSLTLHTQRWLNRIESTFSNNAANIRLTAREVEIDSQTTNIS